VPFCFEKGQCVRRVVALESPRHGLLWRQDSLEERSFHVIRAGIRVRDEGLGGGVVLEGLATLAVEVQIPAALEMSGASRRRCGRTGFDPGCLGWRGR